MAQHIGILRIELGENDIKTIEDSGLNFSNLLTVTRTFNGFESKFPILSGIDEYGDTYFNFIQKKFLCEELRNIITQSPSLFSEANPVIAFLEKAQPKEHIHFVGD